jgi:hypothetical protein
LLTRRFDPEFASRRHRERTGFVVGRSPDPLSTLFPHFFPLSSKKKLKPNHYQIDYLTKVVVQGKQSSSLHVREIMTARSKLLTVPPQVRREEEMMISA